MRPAGSGSRHTIADWLAQPEDRHLELIDGELVEKAAPDWAHGNAQFGLGGFLRTQFNRRGGGGHPGGWWIGGEIDVQLGDNGFRPDLTGWRRERVPKMPRERPVTIRPDWICEVLSESNLRNDLIRKMRLYHQVEVPHYWVVDPQAQTVAVYRHLPEGYVQLRVAERDELARLEPFDAIEIRVGLLFGEDPDDAVE